MPWARPFDVRPLQLGRRLVEFLGPTGDAARQSLVALGFNSCSSLVAGAALGSVTGTFERFPGLLLMVPAAIGLRGNIFGALGNRLSTSIHAGTFHLSVRRESVLVQNVLASLSLIDLRRIRRTLAASRPEGGVLLLTMVSTLVLRLDVAVLIGVAASLVLYLSRTSRPIMRSQVPNVRSPEREFVPVDAERDECPQLKMLTIEGSIYFGAVDHVATHLDILREISPERKHLLLLARNMNFVDVAGAELGVLGEDEHLAGVTFDERGRGGDVLEALAAGSEGVAVHAGDRVGGGRAGDVEDVVLGGELGHLGGHARHHGAGDDRHALADQVGRGRDRRGRVATVVVDHELDRATVDRPGAVGGPVEPGFEPGQVLLAVALERA